MLSNFNEMYKSKIAVYYFERTNVLKIYDYLHLKRGIYTYKVKTIFQHTPDTAH